jgi:Holliday junction resolvase RusA-like endonuclease
MLLKFTINAKAVPKARPRMNKFGSVYTPKKTRDFEQLVAHHAYQYMISNDCKLFENAVEAILVIAKKYPQKWSKEKKEQAMNGNVYWTSKPDIDNLEKSVLDGLNGICWLDDSQVVKTQCEKIYSDKDFIKIELRQLDG